MWTVCLLWVGGELCSLFSLWDVGWWRSLLSETLLVAGNVDLSINTNSSNFLWCIDKSIQNTFQYLFTLGKHGFKWEVYYSCMLDKEPESKEGKWMAVATQKWNDENSGFPF